MKPVKPFKVVKYKEGKNFIDVILISEDGDSALVFVPAPDADDNCSCPSFEIVARRHDSAIGEYWAKIGKDGLYINVTEYEKAIEKLVKSNSRKKKI